MNKLTTIMVLLAGASLAGALTMRPSEKKVIVAEGEQGTALFETFTDPNAATSLDVQAWNDESARLDTFSVKFTEGLWTIPSHNGYPADGTERMGKAAASFVGLNKDVVRSNMASDHGSFGVVSPENVDAVGAAKGTHVKITDESGAVLVDVIVGKEVPDKQGYRFLRYADKNRVYAVRMDFDISTNFVDWIEDDLLKFNKDKAAIVSSNAYRVDEKTQQVVDTKRMTFKKVMQDEGSDKFDWVPIEGTTIPDGKLVANPKLNQIVGAASRLKIVGVRSRPQMLNDVMLRSKGFFLAREPMRLFGNEGEIALVQDDGVLYTLYFGEITYDTGAALSGDAKVATTKAKGADGEGSRYLFVSVSYDEKVDKEAQPKEDGSKPAGPTAGRLRAEQLAKRFDKWFYVISNSSFDRLRNEPGTFFKAKPEE